MEEKEKEKDEPAKVDSQNVPQTIKKESDEEWFKNWTPDSISELQKAAEELENQIADATKDMLRANRKIQTLKSRLNIVLGMIK